MNTLDNLISEVSELQGQAWGDEKLINFNHVRAIVERFEIRNADLTRGESLNKVACVLTMFGDEGKKLLIRLAAINKELKEDNVDKIWDWALKNNRKFKTINSFLRIAKDFNIDTTIPNIDDLDASKFIPAAVEKEEIDCFNAYGFFSLNNCYCSLVRQTDGRFKHVAFTNFKMRVLYHIHDKKVPRRFIELINSKGHKRAVPAPTDALNSIGAFKKFIEGQGNYLWEGTESQFTRLKRKLFDMEKSCVQLETLGWSNKNNFYAFSNGIFHKEKFLPVDENGVLTVGEHNFFIPSGNQSYIDDEFMHANEKKFKFVSTSLTFEDWCKLFCAAYGNAGIQAMCYNLSCLFSDIIYPKVKGFPMMFFYGEGGSGKGSLIKSCMHLYGDPQNALTLTGKANTDKAKIRKFAQYVNSMMMLEEFSNSLAIDSIMMLRAIWDRMGYERSAMESKFGTENVPINSGVGITGNDYPLDDPLLQRLIITEMNANSFSDETRKNYNALEKQEVRGLSGILTELLPLREKFLTGYERAFDEAFKKIKAQMCGISVTERMIKNVAALHASFSIAHESVVFPFTAEQLLSCACNSLAQQNSKRNTSGEVSKWWDIMISLIKNNVIEHGREFKIDGSEMTLQFNNIHSEYMKEHSNIYRTIGLGKATMLDKLKLSEYFIEVKDSFRFGGMKTSGHVFDYNKISASGVDLISVLEYAETARRKKERNGFAVIPQTEAVPEKDRQMEINATQDSQPDLPF